MKVLIVEDESVTRRMFSRTLEKWNYEVTTSVNGRDALNKYLNNDYDILLTDWVMPEMDGIELVEHIRRLGNYIYIIMITAKSDGDDIIKAFNSGVDDFIAKPFDRDELRGRMIAAERIVRLINSTTVDFIQRPLQFYSCFISHSSKDTEFASKLYKDLTDQNIACWFATEDMKIGEYLRDEIHNSIRTYDKLLLVLSKNSIYSQWVEVEVELALEKERENFNTYKVSPKLIETLRGYKISQKVLNNLESLIEFTYTGKNIFLGILEKTIGEKYVAQYHSEIIKYSSNKKNVLFPISIDNEITKSNTSWAKYILTTRNIGDFTEWNNEISYRNSFKKILRDLSSN